MEHINTFLVFAIAFQALIFTIIFLRQNKNHIGRMLGIYELFYFFTYAIVFTFHIQEFHVHIFFYPLLFPMYALLLVLFYFFIKQLTGKKLRKKDGLHYTFPAILLLANVIVLPFLSDAEKISLIVENNIPEAGHVMSRVFFTLHKTIFPLLLISQAFLYVILCVREVIKYRNKIKEEYSYAEGINLKWALELLVVFTGLFIVSLIVNSDVYNYSFILIIALMIGINSVHYIQKTDNIIIAQAESSILVEKLAEKYNYSSLSEMEKDSILKQIKDYMITGKKYLNPDLRLTDVAEALNTNRQYISQVINEKEGENFYHYTNKFRINEFMLMYRNGQFKHNSIEGMASKVGFKAKSSFYGAFKRLNGITPREFIKKNNAEESTNKGIQFSSVQ